MSPPFPKTPRVRKVIEYAIDEAQGLNHNYIGPEHLLLELLRESEGVAAQVLMQLGLNLERARAEIENLLRAEPIEHFDEVEKPNVVTEPAPEPLANAQLEMVRDRIKRLQEVKEQLAITKEFEQAAHCVEEIKGLHLLLEWYEWLRNHTDRYPPTSRSRRSR